MEVRLPRQQEDQLHELAARTGRTADQLIEEAVARLLSHDQWFREQVQIGIDQIARNPSVRTSSSG